MVMPPWPSFISQLRMTTFSTGVFSAAAVGVAARLQGDAVVAGVEETVLDEHVAARLGIAAVVVRAVRDDFDPAHGDVRAERRMRDPERRVADGHAFDEHVLAAIRLDERRPEEVTRPVDALRDRHAVLAPA